VHKIDPEFLTPQATDNVAVTHQLLDEEVAVTISVGAVPSQVAATLTELLVHADEALYAAKVAGRARLVNVAAT
ncbi:MAG: diguanylate cyclase, partial [Pseudomonadota bacterium]